jgi:hypothetical protein
MVERDVVLAKIAVIDRCLARIADVRGARGRSLLIPAFLKASSPPASKISALSPRRSPRGSGPGNLTPEPREAHRAMRSSGPVQRTVS